MRPASIVRELLLDKASSTVCGRLSEAGHNMCIVDQDVHVEEIRYRSLVLHALAARKCANKLCVQRTWPVVRVQRE
eukprot:4931508-Pleurochrysis_carterae.AAC.6